MSTVRHNRHRTQLTSRPSASSDEVPCPRQGTRWYKSVWFTSLLSGVALWAAFPPLDWWPLAWIAPLGWLWAARPAELPTRRTYWALYVGGAIYWLAALEGIRQAHWTLYFGWLALALYVAIYIPAFVAITRLAVHRFRIPLLVAAPVAWTGLELVRGHMLTGFSVGSLGHTQIYLTPLLQASDLGGAYVVSFVMILVTASLLYWLPGNDTPRGERYRIAQKLSATAAAALVLVAMWSYGLYRMAATPSSEPVAQIALVQHSIDTIFEDNPERDLRAVRSYLEVTQQAVEQHPELDIIVWPESMFMMPSPDYRFTYSEILHDEKIAPPEDPSIDPELYQHNVRVLSELFRRGTVEFAERFDAQTDGPTYFLVGTQTTYYGPEAPERYNSALLIGPEGKIHDRYYKMHPVMFGEYIPLGSIFPWIYKLTPMPHGLTPGDGPRAFEAAGLRISPSICFESTVPHLIRRQVAQLEQESGKPDVLVNVTNDGWFWGASILDLQLRCAVFRAVENRVPMLVAANTGLSAWIDGNGQIVEQSPRQAADVIVVNLQKDSRKSLYTRWGDWFSGTCLAASLLVVAAAFFTRKRG